MIRKYNALITPLLALVILTMGSALLTTFISLQLASIAISNIWIASMTTAYYAGMVLGAFKLEKLILRVGHIRSYSAFASMLAIISILHGFYIDVSFWLVLRFLGGIATAGLYVVIESWILGSTTNKNRGKFLAIYMIALYVAQAFGQTLLNIHLDNILLLYCISGILASLSVIPLTLTKASIPIISEPEILGVKKILSLSRSGVMTCLASGMILGAIYGLYPVFITYLNYPTSDVSIVMSLTILGGMLFQFPLGKLSDIMSRRLLIGILSLCSITVSILIMIYANYGVVVLTILSIIFGGSTFCLYPIGISHTCDRVLNHQIVSATQTLLLFYGIGAMLGPLIASIIDMLFKGYSLLAFIIIICTPLSAFVLIRKQIIAPVSDEDKLDFIPVTELTPVTNEMDPRIDQ